MPDYSPQQLARCRSVAIEANVKRLALFHHAPDASDASLEGFFRALAIIFLTLYWRERV